LTLNGLTLNGLTIKGLTIKGLGAFPLRVCTEDLRADFFAMVLV
jgi:hypothetical protein